MPAIYCGECLRTLELPDDLADGWVLCPGCRGLLEIPATDAPEPAPIDAPRVEASRDESAEDVDSQDLTRQPAADEIPLMLADLVAQDRGSPDPPVHSTVSLSQFAPWLCLLALIPLAILIFAPSDAEHEQSRRRLLEPTVPPLAPDFRLPEAHLERGSHLHWGYGIGSAVVLLTAVYCLTPGADYVAGRIAFTSVATGVVGIPLLMGFQVAAISTAGKWLVGGGFFAIPFYVMKFVGFSYRCAMEQGNGILLSFVGFTCGVGLCEEFIKLLLVIHFIRDNPRADWRRILAVGLAAGLGFGAAEGIIYARDYYNGIEPLLIYVVRFVSCVALHAIWTGIAALNIAADRREAVGPLSFTTIVSWAFAYLPIPILLHGLYDTLLKQDYEWAALLVALASVAWMTYLLRQCEVSTPKVPSMVHE